MNVARQLWLILSLCFPFFCLILYACQDRFLAKCGDGKCNGQETENNCPSDCLVITSMNDATGLSMPDANTSTLPDQFIHTDSLIEIGAIVDDEQTIWRDIASLKDIVLDAKIGLADMPFPNITDIADPVQKDVTQGSDLDENNDVYSTAKGCFIYNLVLDCNSTIQYSTIGQNSLIDGYKCLNSYLSLGPEILFPVESSFSGGINLHLESANPDVVMLIYILLPPLDAPCDTTNCLNWSVNEFDINLGVEPGDMFYVAIDGLKPTDKGEFTLEISCDTKPDDCGNGNTCPVGYVCENKVNGCCANGYPVGCLDLSGCCPIKYPVCCSNLCCPQGTICGDNECLSPGGV